MAYNRNNTENMDRETYCTIKHSADVKLLNKEYSAGFV
jgi:hypothetical protein